MAKILKFTLTAEISATPGTRRAVPEDGASGEVVIFPGVRLERHALALSDRRPDPEPAKPSLKRRRRSRGK